MALIVFFVKALIEAVWDVIKFVPYIAATLIFEALATPLTIDYVNREAEVKKKSQA